MKDCLVLSSTRSISGGGSSSGNGSDQNHHHVIELKILSQPFTPDVGSRCPHDSPLCCKCEVLKRCRLSRAAALRLAGCYQLISLQAATFEKYHNQIALATLLVCLMPEAQEPEGCLQSELGKTFGNRPPKMFGAFSQMSQDLITKTLLNELSYNSDRLRQFDLILRHCTKYLQLEQPGLYSSEDILIAVFTQPANLLSKLIEQNCATKQNFGLGQIHAGDFWFALCQAAQHHYLKLRATAWPSAEPLVTDSKKKKNNQGTRDTASRESDDNAPS
jgi:hypothetical protein